MALLLRRIEPMSEEKDMASGRAVAEVEPVPVSPLRASIPDAEVLQ